jgi:hypothetical protein
MALQFPHLQTRTPILDFHVHTQGCFKNLVTLLCLSESNDTAIAGEDQQCPGLLWEVKNRANLGPAESAYT